MVKPRFSLRMLFVAIAIISLPLGFVVYNLSWIERRRDWWRNVGGAGDSYSDPTYPAPGLLDSLVNTALGNLTLESTYKDMGTNYQFWSQKVVKDAERLFPEAKISGNYLNEKGYQIPFPEKDSK